MYLYKPSVVESYVKGYHSGVTWPDRWEGTVPGGPYVKQIPKGRGGWAFEPTSLEEHTAWLAGWDYGHQVKHGKAKPLHFEQEQKP